MKKLMFITPVVSFILILFLANNYIYYRLDHGMNEMEIMIFYILPIFLNIIIVGIGWIIHLIEQKTKS